MEIKKGEKMARNHEIKVKLSQGEKEKIKYKAEDMGLNPAEFLRMLGLKSVIKTEINQK